MAQGIEAWYYGLPQLTRSYLSVCFLFTLLSTLGLLNPLSLYLDFELVWSRFQLWRLPTCFMFLGKFSFPFLMQLMILCVWVSVCDYGRVKFPHQLPEEMTGPTTRRGSSRTRSPAAEGPLPTTPSCSSSAPACSGCAYSSLRGARYPSEPESNVVLSTGRRVLHGAPVPRLGADLHDSLRLEPPQPDAAGGHLG